MGALISIYVKSLELFIDNSNMGAQLFEYKLTKVEQHGSGRGEGDRLSKW